MAENKTAVTDVDPHEFLAGIADERQRAESEELLELMGEATGNPARMWGPSIVGFGELHYAYDSGREGDTLVVGFSPRKGKFALYGLTRWSGSDELLEQLGPHQLGASCLYVTRLERVDREVLRRLVRGGWEAGGDRRGVAPS